LKPLKPLDYLGKQLFFKIIGTFPLYQRKSRQVDFIGEIWRQREDDTDKKNG